MLKQVAKIGWGLGLMGLVACSGPEVVEDQLPLPEGPTFKLLSQEASGVDFQNNLPLDMDLNIFNYMYFYNGGGVGAGDLNNDGLVDLFFTSNRETNRLYLNQGGMSFKDITDQTGMVADSGWSNGVSIVDINQDGMLDIYVSQVGDFEILKGQNLLYVCQSIDDQGIPHYEEKAAEYGLDLVGFGTQAAFFDYDLDGDLDVYQMNHSLHANGTFGQRKGFLGTSHPLSGDRFLRNDGGKFVDITEKAGIFSMVVGYGLGIAVSDINLDGYPDLYIGNDFHENDYLYLNNQDGTFKEVLTEQLMHTSRFSMGVDLGDINNDAHPDIISLDMLPYDPEILKKSEGEDAFATFRFKLGYGYNHQYAKNNLQINNGDGTFSEVAMQADIHATDWSWAPLFVDFDNDGMKDLFVSNGIPKRMNDMDYINFMANDDIQWRIRTKNMEEGDLGVIEKMPEIKLPNKFFRNAGQYRFQDLASTVENNLQTYSNGAIYADLDNDGDLDIVVNNIDAPASVYENLHQAEKRDHMSLVLHGSPTNRNAIGARVLVYSGEEVRLYEKYPVKGFQSSMEIPLHIGLGSTPIDSIFLIWPDRSYQQLDPTALDQELYYPMDIPAFDFARLHQKEDHGFQAADITESTGIVFQHEENPFVEFNREPLIPHMTSAEGPALAVGDINGDGLDDVFIGGAKRTQSAVFVQGEGGYFQELPQPALEADSVFEDVDAVFADVNKDGHADLLIASGGNEYFYKERYLFPRVYLNDGNGRFQAKPDAFDSLLITASCILPYDFTGDGHLDLFIGGRAVSWAYGEAAPSFLLVNDGTGKFTDETASRAKELVKVGLVKNASWGDLDGDQDQDLMLAMEWDEILAFENKNGKFSKVSLSNGKKGWWNFVEPVDVDGDGDLDLLAGNLGLNARLKASDKEPIRMYFNDFDGNGRREQILTYYLQGREIPFANKVEMEKQLPDVKRKFLFAADFAKAKVEDIVDLKKLKEGETLEANYFSNALLINDGNWNFTLKALPYDAQHTPLKDALVRDVNKDGHPDLIVGGNFYENNIQMGRYDADYGSVLLNDGAGNFSRVSLGEVIIKGQTRQIKPISIGGVESVIFARNNATPVIVNLR